MFKGFKRNPHSSKWHCLASHHIMSSQKYTTRSLQYLQNFRMFLPNSFFLSIIFHLPPYHLCEANGRWEQVSSSRVRFETYLSKFPAIEIGKNPIIYNESH